MKRKVPSPPPPPLPPAKPRRAAGASKMTRSTGDANMGDTERGGGGEEETTKISSRRRNNHHRKDSIPIPWPTHKYTTTNPSTMSPVYHLVYDLTSPPSPNYNYKQTAASTPDQDQGHTGNNNNSVTALSSSTGLANGWSSTSLGLSQCGPTPGQNLCIPTFTSATHLPTQGGHRQVDFVTSGGRDGGVLDGLQVKTYGSQGRREGGGRGEGESDTGINWGKPANVSFPPAPGRRDQSSSQAMRIREQNEAISAVPVNGDSDRPPPLPPPRVPTIINPNGDAADGTNWATVTNNTGPFFQPHLLNNTNQKTQFSEQGRSYLDNVHRSSYRSSKSNCTGGSKLEFSNKNRSNNNNQSLSHTAGDYTGAANIQVDKSWDGRGLGDGDGSQIFQRVGEEEGDKDRASRGARAEFPSIEAPSFLLPSHRQGVRHELQTADATGISSPVAPSAGCVEVSGVSTSQLSQLSPVSVKDAVLLWDKPNGSDIGKSCVSDSEPEHCLKKAVFHRHGDSLRFFINHNDSGVVSDNEQSDGNNPPVSIESYVDPVTGKPIDWIISTESKNTGKSKSDKHAGIIAKVLDLTWSRGSGNTNSFKSPSSLLSSFSSSKSTKASSAGRQQQQQDHRPRPPVNRWDNIHVRSPQTHAVSRLSEQGHAGQTFQAQGDNTAPALPPRQPSSSSLPQQQQPQQLLGSVIVPQPQVPGCGGGDPYSVGSNKASTNSGDLTGDSTSNRNFAFHDNLGNENRDIISHSKFNGHENNIRCSSLTRPKFSTDDIHQRQNYSQRLNHSHDGVLHVELEQPSNSQVSGVLNSSSFTPRLNTSASSTSKAACIAVSGITDTATYPGQNRSRAFVSSISFDSPDTQQLLRSYHLQGSSPLSPSSQRPQPDLSELVPASHDTGGGLTWTTSRSDLLISAAPYPGGYRPDQCTDSAVDSNEPPSTPPPPPLPERGLSQHKNFPSFISAAHKQKITETEPPQRSPARLKHIDGASTLSDLSKHGARRGELISFDHLHKVDHSGDLPELTSGAERSPDTQAVLLNSPVSIRTVNTSGARATASSPSEDKLTYQHSLREECKKNQLWNLYGFDLKENHWIKERLSSNNNNAIGLQQAQNPEPFPGARGALPLQELQSQHNNKPAKITPRQKFEILHSRVSEKVATNLRRHSKNQSGLEIDEFDENSAENLDDDGQTYSDFSIESRDKKHIASFNLVQFQNGLLCKESPRARFERDRAARVSAVNARESHSTNFNDAAENSLRLNRSCDELETETFGSRTGSDANFLTTEASLPRSFSPSPDFGQSRPGLAPPIPPKSALCQRLPSGQFGSPGIRAADDPSNNTTDSGDNHYESGSVNHSLWNNSEKNRIPAAAGSRQNFGAAAPQVSEFLIFTEQPKQRNSSGLRAPLVSITNQCSEKSGLQSTTHVDLTGDTSRRVASSVPVKEVSVPLPLSFQQHYVHSPTQDQPVPNSAGTGQWSGLVTSEPDRDKTGTRVENLSDQQSASGLQCTVQQKGQYHGGLADAEILSSDNRISAGSLQAVGLCKDSSRLAEGSQPVSTSVSQSERLLVTREDIKTNLDPDTQGQQSCAQARVGSVSDPHAPYRPNPSEPQKGSGVKKMSPGSVSSSGYESEINSAAQKLNLFNENKNGLIFNKTALLNDSKTLSTVQQLRLRFGHKPDKGDAQVSSNPRKHKAEKNANELNLDSQFNILSLRQGETEQRDSVQDYSDSRRSVHSKIQQYQPDSPASPSKQHKARHSSSSSPRHCSKEEPHNKKLLKKVSRSMHGIIHDLKPAHQGDNRRSPTKHYRSCQHKTHRKRGSRSSPSKPDTVSGRSGSRSASASSECTICGEEAAAIANCGLTDNQPFDSKPDSNNNFKTTLGSTKSIQNQNVQIENNFKNANTSFNNDADINTYNINTASHHHNINGKTKSPVFRAKFFTREEAAMLAAKGLRIYESGEEYIAMRSPVKSPLHKSMSAPQFGWEGAHYLIMPTVVEPFSPNIDSSTAYGITNLNLALAANGSRPRCVSDEDKDTGCNTNTLLTHRSVSDSGASRRCSTSRFDNDLDASDFFTGHRSDGDDYGDETGGFNDINYNDDGTATNNDSTYLPMHERKLSARHRAMSVDVLYRERPERTQSDSEPLSPGRRHMMRRYFQPEVSVDKDTGRGYVEWKTCSGWVGKVDMRTAQNGRNSRGYVEWDTIWTTAAPWGAKEDDEHVYDVIAENSSTCSTEETAMKETSRAENGDSGLKREREARGSVEMKLVTSVALDTPPALPERTYINKIKNTRPGDDNASSSSTSSSAGHRHHHHHHHHAHCKKHHHHHHHHHHSHSHSHHRQHNHHPTHQEENQQQQTPQQQNPPQRPLKPSNLSISSKEQQMQQTSPSTSSPLSTPTKSKPPPLNKPPPKPPRHQHLMAQSHTYHHQQPIAIKVQHLPNTFPVTTLANIGRGIATAAVTENYSEVHKLKGYKFTNLLTATESESPVPHLIHQHPSDPNAIYSETYWHLGPAVAPQAHASVWQSGDVLDYIDGLHDSMSPKRRENIYILLNNKKTRAKFSESLEIESRLMSKGLLSPSPSSTASAASSSPLPAPSSSGAFTSTSFPQSAMSRLVHSHASEVTSFSSPAASSASKTGNMAGSALITPTVITTAHTARVIKRKGATAPVSSTYV
ncbi:hypothetical protein EGW08_010008 [Elysia chlorotica]|uniref:Uncharacterized protein n=1 Tax=Elysia chlorotica TaxID=188477 RepID=A0A433TKY5_ELYCH|nr:hypothetical protein EGW08_010008 [Elysia chlorotica]